MEGAAVLLTPPCLDPPMPLCCCREDLNAVVLIVSRHSLRNSQFVCVHMCVHVAMLVWRSEGNPQESTLSTMCGSWGLGSQCVKSLNRLPGSMPRLSVMK